MEEDLAQWLQEVGRRRYPSRSSLTTPSIARSAPEPGDVAPGLRRALLYAVAGAASLQYLFYETQVRILSIPELIVFIRG